MRSRIIFGKRKDRRHAVIVDGDPEAVVGALKNGWAQLNRSKGDEVDWIWVNADQVLYVEPVRPGGASAVSVPE